VHKLETFLDFVPPVFPKEHLSW